MRKAVLTNVHYKGEDKLAHPANPCVREFPDLIPGATHSFTSCHLVVKGLALSTV